MTEKRTKDLNVPTLRFPGFEDEWKRKKIKELLKIGSGRDYKHLQKGDVPVYGTGGYMTSVNQYLHDGETVCIGRKGTINKPFYHEGKIWTVDTLFYTHSFNGLTPRFGFNIFEKINWLQYNEASGVPSLSKSTIENIEVEIPNEAEQKKIAAFLEKIEERIVTQNKIIEQLESLIKSIREKLFSQELRFKNEKGNEFSEWKRYKLGDVCQIIMGQSPGSNSYNTEGNGLPLIQGNADIENRKTKPRNYTVEITKECEIGDLILTVRAPVGTIAKSIHKACIGRGVCALKTNEENESEYIYQFLINYEPKWVSLEQGSTFTAVGGSEIKSININLPCLNEQKAIAKIIFSIDNKIENEKEVLKILREQKEYLLKQIFI